MPGALLVEEPEWEEPEWEETEEEETEEDESIWEEPIWEELIWEESDWEEPDYEEPDYEEPELEGSELEEPELDEPELEEPESEEPELEQSPMTLEGEGETQRPDCLKGAPGHLRWKKGGSYFDNASGAASIALVATRMLRTIFYHSDVLTAPDVQEIASFLEFVGYEEDVRKYVKGLHLAGQSTGTGSSLQFSGLFGQDDSPSL
ncbi:hypothetical protein ACHAPE_009427 [Trichoderma viride]